SSRRRHTRSKRDWSSDVCSSDLGMLIGGAAGLVVGTGLYVTRGGGILAQPVVFWTLNVVVNTFRPIPFIIFMAAIQPVARLVVEIGRASCRGGGRLAGGEATGGC